MSDPADDALLELARELVGELAGGKVIELMLASQGAAPEHSEAGRRLAGARWQRGVPSAIDGRPVLAVLQHPQSPTLLYDLGDGHFAEGVPGQAPGPVMHSEQFSQSALASTGWSARKLADQAAGSPDSGADPGTDQGAGAPEQQGDGTPAGTTDGTTDEDDSGTPAGDEQDTGDADADTGADTPGDDGTAPSSPAPAAPRRTTPEAAALARQQAEDKLAAALTSGKATDESQTLDGHGQIWTPERASAHSEMVQDILKRSETVPSEGRAVLLAGLGTGKAAALAKAGAIDPARHALVSTEHIKGEMARRGMIPEVDGLKQGESTALVHAEAAHVAGLAVRSLAARRKNIVMDGTMQGSAHTQDWASELRGQGYEDVRGIHLATPADKAVDRARSAHRSGVGKDKQPGPRLIPDAALRDAAGSHGEDRTETVFDGMKGQLDGWSKYDGSGAVPSLTSKGGKPPAPGMRSVEDFTAARERGRA